MIRVRDLRDIGELSGGRGLRDWDEMLIWLGRCVAKRCLETGHDIQKIVKESPAAGFSQSHRPKCYTHAGRKEICKKM